MTQQYLIGELSVRLEELQAAASQDGACDVRRLRQEVETGPVSRLASATAQALCLADRLCWESLSQGDIAAFSRQADISAELHLFAICARLVGDSY